MSDLISKLSARPNLYEQKPASPKSPAKATPGKVAPSQPLYFVNAPVDFLIVGGASILACIILASVYGREPNEHEAQRWLPTLAFYLMWVINWPHFAATNYRLYHSRENIEQYPLTALGVPWLVLAGVIGAVLSPTIIAPYFVKVFLLWSSYHFSGQSVGITLLYARRAGIPIESWTRIGLSTFIYGTFVVSALGSETGTGTQIYYGIPYPQLGLPEVASKIASVIMFAGGLVFLVRITMWAVQNQRMVPLIIGVPALAQFTWFWVSIYYNRGVPAFNVFVPFFHSFQYILIAWSMQLKEKMDRQHIQPSVNYVVLETARWGTVNLVGGIALFALLPGLLFAIATAPPMLPWFDRLEIAALFALNPSRAGINNYTPEQFAELRQLFNFATGVMIAGVQIHHFFVDGVIWKLKRKTVSSPLMVNIGDLTGSRVAKA